MNVTIESVYPDISQVMRALGIASADTTTLRGLADALLQQGREHIIPRIRIHEYSVEDGCIATGVKLTNVGWSIDVARSLTAVYAVVYTLGAFFDEWVAGYRDQVSKQLVADAIGGAALMNFHACMIEQLRSEVAGCISVVASPGSDGWLLKEGQDTLLALVDGGGIGVVMNEQGMLTPLKSCTALIGVGVLDRSDALAHVCSSCSKRDDCGLKNG